MKTYTWNEAVKVVKRLNKKKYQGHTDWRVPTIAELISLIDFTKVDPACKLADMMASYYWSSTAYAGNSNYAWIVYFYYGGVNYYGKTNGNYVRAVRSEQYGLEWSETL